jgi:hypothetical protein
MKKAFLIAACAVLMTGVAANAASLTMSITGSATTPPGSEYSFQITAELGAGSDGLALIGVDLAADGVTLAPLTPGASMSSFVRDDGLTNPAGYGGTESGGALLQIGGGQNTIGYSTDDPAYPNPSYPIGDVVLGIGDEASVVIAEGTVTAPETPGAMFTLTISNAFANTIDEGQTEAPYAVSAVDEPITYTNGGVLEVTVEGGMEPTLTAADSVGAHTGSGDIAFPIDLTTGMVEPRVQGGGELWVNLTFDQDVDAGSLVVSISPDPGVGFGLSAGAASNQAELRYDADVPTGRYEVTVAGTMFPICYAKGDVNCSGDATGLDLGAIQSPSNWNKTLAEGANPRADVNRDGQATGLDLGQVQSPTSWNQPVPPLTCTCP